MALTTGAAAISACGTVDVGEPPADVNACRPNPQFFVDEIWPNFLAQTFSGKTCGDSDCHAASNRVLRVMAPTSTATPSVPFSTGSDWDVLYRSAADHVNCADVAGSEIYTKPAGLRQHEGDKLFAPNGPELELLARWVAGP